MPLLQSDNFLWGKIKDLQVRSKSQWFSILHLPQAPSVCLSAWREGPSSSSAQVSPPQQMLQTGDASRGQSLTRNLIQAEIVVNRHLKAFYKTLPFQFFHPTPSQSLTTKFMCWFKPWFTQMQNSHTGAGRQLQTDVSVLGKYHPVPENTTSNEQLITNKVKN